MVTAVISRLGLKSKLNMAIPFTFTKCMPREWALRGVLAIGAAWLGYGAVNDSIAYAIQGSSTDRAHAISPSNGRITALLSNKTIQSAATVEGLVRADALARMALKQDASAVDAVATLALIAQGRRDNQTARRLFAYSDNLSRRDLRTRLGIIEEAVARGDVPSVLRNYDIALRTSRLAGDILFPVLSSAIADAAVRKQLILMLATVPPWSSSFISYVTMQGPDTQATAALLRALYQQRIVLPTDTAAIIIDRLIAQNQGSAAWTYYATVTPNVDPRRSRDPSFDKGPDVPSAFDWKPLQDSGITTSVQRNEGGGVFEFAAATSIGGPVLRQMQVLPPGYYVLEGKSAEIDQDGAALPYWSLNCLSGREIGRITVPNSGRNGGRFAGRLTVPADCPVQDLTLVTRGSDKVSGTTGQILQTALRPAQRSEPK